MDPTFILSELEQVRALAVPLRTRIVEVLQRSPATAKQVAQSLGERPSRIYHHVDALERAGLLRLVETRRKRGTTERYLEPVARVFIVDRRLFAPERGEERAEAADVVGHAVVDMLTRAAADLQRGIDAGEVPLHDPDRAELAYIPLHTTDERVVALMRRLRDVLAEGIAASADGGDQRYRLLVGLFPARE